MYFHVLVVVLRCLVTIAEGRGVILMVANFVLLWWLMTSNFVSDNTLHGLAAFAVWFAYFYVSQRHVAKGYLGQVFKDGEEPLKGQVAVVTGANSGIGYDAALELAYLGCKKVVLACRSEERAMEAINGAPQHAKRVRGWNWTDEHQSRLVFLPLDVADESSIYRFVDKLDATEGFKHKIDILVNNAGMFTPKLNTTTPSGFDKIFGTNHLGPFRLTELLLPKVTKRLVLVSSFAHIPVPVQNKDGLIALLDDVEFAGRKAAGTFGNRRADALINERAKARGVSEADRLRHGAVNTYGLSKLANLMYARELARRPEVWGRDVVVTALHPGGVTTNVFRELKSVAVLCQTLFQICWFKLCAEGGKTIVHSCVSDSLKSGGYYCDCRLREECATDISRDEAAQDALTAWCNEQWQLKPQFT